MSPSRYMANPRCFCPACGKYVVLDRAPLPSAPADVVLPEAMFSGVCSCNTGITLAVSTLPVIRGKV